MLAEDVEYLVHRTAFLAARVELTVGECARSSFTEAVVRFAVHLLSNQMAIKYHVYHNIGPFELKHLPTSPNHQLYKNETSLSPPFCPYYRTRPNVTSKGLP